MLYKIKYLTSAFMVTFTLISMTSCTGSESSSSTGNNSRNPSTPTPSENQSLVLLSMKHIDENATTDANNLAGHLRALELEHFFQVEFKKATDHHDFIHDLEETLELVAPNAAELSSVDRIERIDMGLLHGNHYHYPSCRDYSAVSVEETIFEMDGHDHDHDHKSTNGQEVIKTMAVKFEGSDSRGRVCDLYLGLHEEHEHFAGDHDHKHIIIKLDYATSDGHRPSASEADFYRYDSSTRIYINVEKNK
jgi:hypothetical protein